MLIQIPDPELPPHSLGELQHAQLNHVAVKLNEEKFLLKSRSAKNIEPQGEKRYDSLSVATGDAQDFTIVSDVNLPRPKSSRYLIFVQNESEEGGVGLDVVSF